QIRSAYLFLVVLLPLLGLVLAALVLPRPEWVRLRLRLAGGLVAACLLPFVAYVAASWVAIREAGFPLMGTYSLFGVAGPLITEDLIDDLPEDLHPFVRRFLEKRKRAERKIARAVRLRDEAARGGPEQPAAPGAEHDPLWTDPAAWWEDPGAV